MSDMISKQAAIGALEERRDQYLKDSPTWLQIQLDIHAIAALPAQGVRVRPLEWIDFEGRGAKAQAWNEANYMIQLWSDGRYEISASYPGYSTFIEGTDRFYPSLDAAKAAAQADYERRILAALDTPAPAQTDAVEALVKAAEEAEEVLRLVEHPAFPDPKHHHEVKALGQRIGFGALMSTASAGWREVLQEKGYPVGGEFVSGPCHASVVNALAKLRAALAAIRGGAK